MTGQTVLITGGTGTFGVALIRHALAQDVRRVISVSRCGHRIANVLGSFNDARVECWTGDVRDADRMAEVMRARPDVVIHAAAIKRIEQCEANPEEAKKTNVDGTLNVVKAALAADVPRVLVISSDKACSPETVYGATKAEAEQQSLGQNALRGHSPTRISAVRYGNVLGSQGSVLDHFMACRQTGAPLTITDVDATRFWWVVEDAVRFVGSVLDRMQGCEIWIPKLVSAKVLDLAKACAPDSEVIVTGMRGPEKRHEAMINTTEARYAWELPDAYVLLPKRGQWWSPEPPADARRVPEGFTYLSSGDPLPVELQESQICANSA